MEGNTYFNEKERLRLPALLLKVGRSLARSGRGSEDVAALRSTIDDAVANGHYGRDSHGINPLFHNLETAALVSDELGADRDMTIAILLYQLCGSGYMDLETARTRWGDDAARMINGLLRASSLEGSHATVMSENFRNLLLTVAEDIRVIILMIADRLTLMRLINHHPDEGFVADVTRECGFLYAPLAHRLGLYGIKSEMEDLTLKYTNREIYTRIARELNATKARRDAYIADFIAPVKQKLEQAGLKFDIKGRTKSISSIWNKIKKQNNDLEHIYDLFAIRIIIDAPTEREKSDCWMAYSLITDMFTPNPARMKDWISIPKSNGYESLHITVRGPEGKWVEVQIRTRRMDLIAEKGFAAHWKYKGIKSEASLDSWISGVRDLLETASAAPTELVKNVRMDIYDKEVFAFTPAGDLFRLPMGATLLDFAFAIHSKLGCRATGGVVNGKHRKLNYKLQNGDTVEVTTASTQSPKQDWLNIAITNKARAKIRQELKERERRAADLAKEMLWRRFKNRKIELDESILSRVVKRLGYKMASDFYHDIAREKLDVADVIAAYELQRHHEENPAAGTPVRSAEEFALPPVDNGSPEGGVSHGASTDVIVIGDNIKGINYRLSRCCNPIFGDDVFGFISSEGVIKIHRSDCPNARNIRDRYPYRVINTRWAGSDGHRFTTTLHVVGQDDLGIVTNITSIITKETNSRLRNISIDSHDGLFRGFLVVEVDTTATLSALIKKIKGVKGVKDVTRG